MIIKEHPQLWWNCAHYSTNYTSAPGAIEFSVIENRACTCLGEVVKEADFESLKAGKDTFVALPSGYGILIIYAILPSAFNKIKGFV